MFEDVGKYWKMLEMYENVGNIGNCSKILENIETLLKMFEDFGKCWNMLKTNWKTLGTFGNK